LFEPPCAACRQPLGAPLDGAVCAACWASLGAGRGIDVRFAPPHAVRWAAAVDAYEGRMKDVIHALKYDRRRSIAPRLGALMRESGAALLHGADAVVPVPLHRRREYSRGFNQAHDLATHLGLPVVPLLRRVMFTRSQIELPKEARLANVNDAFAWHRDLRSLIPDPRIVVLVDDVATTGATLESCARVLLQSGVREVRALTAARVVSALKFNLAR
jgi:ComF family protein